jgi:hypothetical protein
MWSRVPEQVSSRGCEYSSPPSLELRWRPPSWLTLEKVSRLKIVISAGLGPANSKFEPALGQANATVCLLFSNSVYSLTTARSTCLPRNLPCLFFE